MSKILEPGTTAPDFELPISPEKNTRLSDYRGKPVVLVFYPNDWSPVCGAQLPLYNEMLFMFKKYQAQVIGISVDSTWSHQAYTDHKKLDFPIAADFEPKGAVAKLYGVYREKEGRSERALFVIDKYGVIQWSYLSPIVENPGADGILRALQNISEEDGDE